MPEKAFVLKGEDPTFNQYVDFFKFLQIGRIVSVDNERNVVNIQFQSNVTFSQDVAISNPFFTGRAFMGGMPEIGSYVVCGFIKLTNTSGVPVILAYLDFEYINSLQYVYDDGKTTPDVISLNSIHDKLGYDVRRKKRIKQYPGDVGAESTQGSGLFLTDNITISDSKLNEIFLSASDRTIYTNSINNHTYTNAARVLNGMIIRPNATAIQPVVLDNGQLLYVVTDGASPDVNGQPFTELRTELKEFANSVLDVIESYDSKDFSADSSTGRLLLSQIFGTLVGNEKTDMAKYGKILRPQIFAPSGSIIVDDVVCTPEQFTRLASAYQLRFAGGTKFDIDKEGQAFVHLSASSVRHPLGAGRSLEFAADGSLKFAIGKTNIDEKSLELDTTGKVKMNFGYDSNSLQSFEWQLARGMKITVSAPDTKGYALYQDFTGNVYEKVRGDKTIDVDGTLNIVVKGKIQEDIQGAKNENYVNDKMTNYGGDYQEIITKSRQTKIGEGLFTDIATKGEELNITEGDKKETLTLGDKDVKLVAGNSKETLLLGDKETSLTNGNITETILKGNKETKLTSGDSILEVVSGNIKQSVKLGDSTEEVGSGNKSVTVKIGDFTVKVTSGNVTIQTTTGKVDVASATQTVKINGMTKVEIVSATKVEVKAPMVDIGSSPVKGNVVCGLPGVASHYDYITGAPLKGSMTVKATI